MKEKKERNELKEREKKEIMEGRIKQEERK
jgi:hypothetical protein